MNENEKVFQNRGQFVEKNMSLSVLGDLLAHLPNTDTMPMLFVGHGSPMNSIMENGITQAWAKVGQNLLTPKLILCISAHWETMGTAITAMPSPKTIHDFYGFPQSLYDLRYPAPGDPLFAQDFKQMFDPMLAPKSLQLDETWGLDHGTWSVIRHIYPKADIPVLQLSLDRSKSPTEHYMLAKMLKALRQKGVLIVGSGNIVHNLRAMDFDKAETSYGYDWAIEVQQVVNQCLRNKDHQTLMDYQKQGRAFSLAIPTPEHFLPLLYVLQLQEDKDNLTLFNDQLMGGSISMTSCVIGTEASHWF